MHKTACIVFVFFTCFVSYGNEIGLDDSLSTSDTSRLHLPKRAAILSAVLPGAGQIYNEIGYRKVADKKHRAWWKVPIVYGGLGAFGYYFYHNNQMANLTRQEIEKRDELGIADGGYYDERFKNYSDRITLIAGTDPNSELSFAGYDKFANRRDIFAFAFLAFWGLNVVEAYVDAHFVTFDVSEDLSLSLRPTLIGYQHPGVNLRFNFN